MPAVKERPPLRTVESEQIRSAFFAERSHRTAQFDKQPIQPEFSDWVCTGGQWFLSAAWLLQRGEKPGNHGFRIAYGHVVKLEVWAPGVSLQVSLVEQPFADKMRLALDLAFGPA